jgi:anti-sigma regulatory factor (Ser/Thr protein kinase)
MNELRVGASLEVLSAVGAFVLEAAHQAGLDRRATYRLRLAVDEIVTNVIVHGKPREHSGDGEIRLRAEMDEHTLQITLEDRGPAFNPLEREGPDQDLEKPLEQRPIGGLGVFLAARGVDRFQYERAGDRNRHIFVMNRPGGAEQSA